MIDVISGAAVPSSFMRPRRRQPCRPSVISVCMSASFFWIELVGGERPAELLAVERVLARRVPAEFGGAERAPGDAVARAVEAAERALQALARSGKQVLLRARTRRPSRSRR